jgi:hypothetical protein
MEEEKKDKGFVVRDRRLFDESGEARREDAAPEAKSGAETTGPGDAQPAGGAQTAAEEQDDFLPEANFMNFILSLSTTAMFHFGDFPDPASGQAKKNLAAAKHTIDTIAMIETKTRGNLDSNEKSMLDAVLFELRMRYVKEKG